VLSTVPRWSIGWIELPRPVSHGHCAAGTSLTLPEGIWSPPSGVVGVPSVASAGLVPCLDYERRHNGFIHSDGVMAPRDVEVT